MALDLDSALGIHVKALAARTQRAELISTNLANADTPNYKARDIDFRATLGKVNSDMPIMQITNTNHIAMDVNEPGEGVVYYRTPIQPSLDGNTVDTQIEQTEFARNAVQSQASVTFLSGRIRTLLLAIKGQ